MADCTVRACWASIMGWRAYTGTTPVPEADTGDLRAGRGQQGQGVGPEDLGGEGVVEPASAKRRSWATVSGTDCSTSIRVPMRRGLAIVRGLLA